MDSKPLWSLINKRMERKLLTGKAWYPSLAIERMGRKLLGRQATLRLGGGGRKSGGGRIMLIKSSLSDLLIYSGISLGKETEKKYQLALDKCFEIQEISSNGQEFGNLRRMGIWDYKP